MVYSNLVVKQQKQQLIIHPPRCMAPNHRLLSRPGFCGTLRNLIQSAHTEPPTLKITCMELGRVACKWFKIGIQLGIPRGKLKEFEKEDDPLSAIIDYWLSGNVGEDDPVSWRSIVAALESSHVDEPGLANRISKKYCIDQSKQAGR